MIWSNSYLNPYLRNGFFFDTLLAQFSNRVSALVNSKRSANERNVMICSMTSSGKSRIDTCFKPATFAGKSYYDIAFAVWWYIIYHGIFFTNFNKFKQNQKIFRRNYLSVVSIQGFCNRESIRGKWFPSIRDKWFPIV